MYDCKTQAIFPYFVTKIEKLFPPQSNAMGRIYVLTDHLYFDSTQIVKVIEFVNL